MRHKYRQNILFVALIALLMTCALPAKAEQNTCSERQILVTGRAEIFVKPDRVRMAFGVSEKSKDLKTGSDNIGKVLGKALSFLKNSGIQDKHIQTSHVSIRPEFHFDGNTRETSLLVYALSQSFAVTLEEPAKYEEIFRTLLGLGINEVQDVSFSTSESQKHQDEALVAAVKAAEKKARLLADAAGLTLGKAISIQELHQERIFPRISNVMLNTAQAMDAAGEQAGEGFALGSIPIKAEVSVVYKAD